MDAPTVFEQLRKDILTCELAPGAAIYEQELAQRFGISKSPVRDALLRLQEQNLVEVRARSGYRIKPVSIADANEIYELRHIYERACVTRAIHHASAQQIEDLQQYVTTDGQMEMREWIALNRRFHSALAVISGNALLAEAANQLNDHVDRLTFVSLGQLRRPADFAQLNKQHAAIIEALRLRDKRTALAVLKSHIDKSHHRTIRGLENSAIRP